MKAQNHKAVTKGYLLFSAYLAACVIVGVLAYFCYMQTSFIEVNKIFAKTVEYDKIHTRQNELSDKIGDLYQYINQLNTDKNDKMLMEAISNRKQEITLSMKGIDNRDVKIHRQLMGEVDSFLGIKDSIRTAKSEEAQVKKELRQCIDDNKQLTRKMTKGRMSIK